MIASELPQLKERQDILTISHLRFSFSEKSAPVLHDISLKVYKGEIVAILGGSGCGKSTLLNLIAGLIKPQCGEIKIRDRHNDSSRIGYIFQEDALLPWRTVAANLALAREIGKVTRERFESSLWDFLNSFHLDRSILNKYPTQLSGGMKQRVSIIQTLLFNPSLLLLDEPFSALDFYTKLCLESEFYNLVKDKGKTAILVTHDIEEAIAVADRVVLLGQGGTIHADIPVRFACSIRDPENVRGLAEFAHYYRNIWGQLKTVIGQ